MNSVGQPARCQYADTLLEWFEILPDAGPAVDHEEDIAERIGGDMMRSVGAQAAQLRHRFDAPFAELSFSPPQQTHEFRDGTTDPVCCEAIRHGADMWETCEPGKVPPPKSRQ